MVASDPFIDLSLTSISQLALAERHADGFQNLAGGGREKKRSETREGGSGFTMMGLHQYPLFHSAYYWINLR